MRGRLLIIGGVRAGADLSLLLEQAGFTCIQARGPLRVRDVLEAEPIDAVIWNQESENPELAQDIAREWQKHPQLPVVHLFPASSAEAAVDAQVIESIPTESAQSRLLMVLERLFNRPSSETFIPEMPRSELAFRHVLSTLRSQHLDDPSVSDTTTVAWEAPTTSVNAAERTRLTMGRGRQPVSHFRWRHWLRAFFGSR